jgi:hypothetical protein
MTEEHGITEQNPVDGATCVPYTRRSADGLSSRGPIAGEPMEMAFFLPLFVTAFPSVWVGALYIVSIIGPWSFLARHYPHDETVRGTSYRVVSMSAGLVSYSSCLTAIANDEFLTIKPLLPFRPFHPPFTLPRSAIHDVLTARFLFFRTVSFSVAGRELRLFGSVATATFWTNEGTTENRAAEH